MRLSHRTLAVCMLALGAAPTMGCADDDKPGVHASLHGVVRDADSRKRLSGVQVEFESDTLDTASDKTNSSGYYRLILGAATPVGRLTASKDGYETRVVSAYLDDDDVSIDIELTRK